jgi:hypothetical protein
MASTTDSTVTLFDKIVAKQIPSSPVCVHAAARSRGGRRRLPGLQFYRQPAPKSDALRAW